MAGLPRVSVREWESVARDVFPDDRFFVALLTLWVALLAVVTYLLLGLASAGVLITVGGLCVIVTIAVEARQRRRHDRGPTPLDRSDPFRARGGGGLPARRGLPGEAVRARGSTADAQ